MARVGVMSKGGPRLGELKPPSHGCHLPAQGAGAEATISPQGVCYSPSLHRKAQNRAYGPGSPPCRLPLSPPGSKGSRWPLCPKDNLSKAGPGLGSKRHTSQPGKGASPP